MFKHLTLQSIANEIFNNVKSSVVVTKDKILLEIFMAMRYKINYSVKGMYLGNENDQIVVKGVFNAQYKITRMMQEFGYDPTLTRIGNYNGYEKFDLFIDEDKRPHKTLEEYIAGSEISLKDLKAGLKDLKHTNVTNLESLQMLKISLDDYIGFTIYPTQPGITTPYYFTYKEFMQIIK